MNIGYSLRVALLFVSANVSALQETFASAEEDIYGRELKWKSFRRSSSEGDSDSDKTGLIITGVIVGLFIIAAIVFFIVKKCKKPKKIVTDVEQYERTLEEGKARRESAQKKKEELELSHKKEMELLSERNRLTYAAAYANLATQ